MQPVQTFVGPGQRPSTPSAPLERRRAVPPKRAREEEAGTLRLTSARVARAHAQAVGHAGEHRLQATIIAPFARELSLLAGADLARGWEGRRRQG
jgi:hypothetical protein